MSNRVRHVAPRALALLLAIATAPLAAGRARAETADEDPYASTFARSAEEERAGRLDAAVAILQEATRRWPDDYALALQTAWLLFRAERWEEAEAAYRRAEKLSGGAYDARLGLAWTRARRGDCDDAKTRFATLATERPEDARVRDGLAVCEAKVGPRYTVWGTGTLHAYASHPTKSDGFGLATGFVALPGAFQIAAAYRGTWVAYDGESARPASTLTSFAQHEAYGTLGVGSKLVGVSAHYAYVRDGSETSGDSHHVGATLRYSPSGDLLLAESSSFYADQSVHRLELSWRAPLSQSIAIRPALAGQYTGRTWGYAGYLTLLGDHGRFGWWLGAKGGREIRPLYFGQAILFDWAETISAGATAGARVDLAGVSFTLGYDLALLRLSGSSGTRGGAKTSTAHLITLGVAYGR
jgi:tetratricopeptide (TPR) repeat protein